MSQTPERDALPALDPPAGDWPAILEHVPDAICTVDGGLAIRFAHPAPFTPGARPAAPADGLFEPRHREAFRDLLGRVWATGAVETFEGEGVGAPGAPRPWLAARVCAMRQGPETTGLVVICSDATARHGAEQALHEREAQLRQAQKMEAVGQLAAGIAHDFNNLLTGILGFGQLLARQLESGDKRREDVGQILRAAQRASELTHRLLAFGRQQVLAPRQTDLRALLAEMQPMLRRVIREDIRLDLAGEGPATVQIDPGQFEQVIMNLVVNARDAMPAGGAIRLRTATLPLAAAEVEALDLGAPGEYVRVSVEDTGEGMDAPTRARLFEPFFTTKAPGKGTGLGLAVVYGIVRQSEGTITVESEPGRGTRFDLWFPARRHGGDTGRRLAPPPRPAPAPGKGGDLTVLVVEDEDPLRDLVIRVLRGGGFRVLAAADGAEALRLVAQASGTIDLVLTDMIMPVMNGWELIRQVRASHPELRVIYMTGYADTTLIKREVLASGAALLQKPFTPETLEGAVATALGRVAPHA